LITRYSRCTINQGSRPAKISTAPVKVRFTGTPAQIELAVEMIQEVLEGFRTSPGTVSPLQSIALRWQQAAEARAAGVGVVREAFSVPSVDTVLGNAGHVVARKSPAAEAAPRVAALGNGDGRLQGDTVASPQMPRAAETKFVVEYPVGVVGCIIGPKGAVINSIAAASGCHFKHCYRLPPGVMVQKVTFCGTQAQIDLAMAMVQVRLNTGSLDARSYAARHAVQMLEANSCGPHPSTEGLEQSGGAFLEVEAGKTRCSRGDAAFSHEPISRVTATAAPSVGQAHSSGSTSSSDASVEMSLSCVSTGVMSARGEEQSAGHPSSRKRCSPSRMLALGPAEAADGAADGGCGKRARAEHSGAIGVGFSRGGTGGGGGGGGGGGAVLGKALTMGASCAAAAGQARTRHRQC